jgi:hypothetical protein
MVPACLPMRKSKRRSRLIITHNSEPSCFESQRDSSNQPRVARAAPKRSEGGSTSYPGKGEQTGTTLKGLYQTHRTGRIQPRWG